MTITLALGGAVALVFSAMLGLIVYLTKTDQKNRDVAKTATADLADAHKAQTLQAEYTANAVQKPTYDALKDAVKRDPSSF